MSPGPDEQGRARVDGQRYGGIANFAATTSKHYLGRAAPALPVPDAV